MFLLWSKTEFGQNCFVLLEAVWIVMQGQNSDACGHICCECDLNLPMCVCSVDVNVKRVNAFVRHQCKCSKLELYSHAEEHSQNV